MYNEGEPLRKGFPTLSSFSFFQHVPPFLQSVLTPQKPPHIYNVQRVGLKTGYSDVE